MQRPLTSLALCLCVFPLCLAQEVKEERWEKPLQEYRLRQEQASRELNARREHIASERVPLLKSTWALQEEVLLLERRLADARNRGSEQQSSKNRLLKEQEQLGKTQAYLRTLIGDSLKASVDNLALGPDKEQELQGRTLLTSHDQAAGLPGELRLPESLRFMLDQVKGQLGSRSFPGQAVPAGDSLVLSGRFVTTGPETFFRSDDGQVFGRVAMKPGSPLALVHPLKEWSREGMEGLFLRASGTIPADPSGGKALRLQETRGSLYSHISKGGYVAFVIIGVGLVAISLVVQKLMELLRNPVDTQDRVLEALRQMPPSSHLENKRILGTLKGATRELFREGLSQLGKPRQTLEEHLYACLLRIRLRYEHRLTLLAVIATAAPLLGLLGTVMGMVKTFALITVFGTGNAGRLSSGISEVLVATELGLMVAIPALVAHGFLAHRIHKNMAMLERYSMEFVSAASPDVVTNSCMLAPHK